MEIEKYLKLSKIVTKESYIQLNNSIIKSFRMQVTLFILCMISMFFLYSSYSTIEDFLSLHNYSTGFDILEKDSNTVAEIHIEYFSSLYLDYRISILTNLVSLLFLITSFFLRARKNCSDFMHRYFEHFAPFFIIPIFFLLFSFISTVSSSDSVFFRPVSLLPMFFILLLYLIDLFITTKDYFSRTNYHLIKKENLKENKKLLEEKLEKIINNNILMNESLNLLRQKDIPKEDFKIIEKVFQKSEERKKEELKRKAQEKKEQEELEKKLNKYSENLTVHENENENEIEIENL